MPTGQAILIATGDDHPGVLDDVSLYLHERRANILDSRVSLLRGQFALLLLVKADAEAMRAIASGLSDLSGRIGVKLELRPAAQQESQDITPVRLTARGHDAAGVLQRLSHLLRVLHVNIDDIETNTFELAPGQTRFELEMRLSVPRATPLMMLKQYAEGLADEAGFEVDVQAM